MYTDIPNSNIFGDTLKNNMGLLKTNIHFGTIETKDFISGKLNIIYMIPLQDRGIKGMMRQKLLKIYF